VPDLPGYALALMAEGANPPQERPLGGYAVLISAYCCAVAGFLLHLRASGRELPERPSAGDIALLAVATHKASRLIAKDKVSSAVRAPFAEVEGRSGPGEVSSRSRGTGLQRAIGDLITCPHCIGQWVATVFAAGLVTAPRVTRFVAGLLTIVAAADFLQLAYRAGEVRLEP
jgi:hypothetical protein